MGSVTRRKKGSAWSETDTEALPNVPGRVGCCGATTNDSCFDGVADKAKVSAEFIAGFRQHMLQECTWR